jgi:hypothetical protein
MTDKERNEIRAKIASQINDLRVEIESLEKASRPIAPDNALGRHTRTEAINAYARDNEMRGLYGGVDQAAYSIHGPRVPSCYALPLYRAGEVAAA